MQTTLQNALDVFLELNDEEKNIFLDITKKLIIEKRRKEMKIKGVENIRALQENKIQTGNSDDLIADLET